MRGGVPALLALFLWLLLPVWKYIILRRQLCQECRSFKAFAQSTVVASSTIFLKVFSKWSPLPGLACCLKATEGLCDRRRDLAGTNTGQQQADNKGAKLCTGLSGLTEARHQGQLPKWCCQCCIRQTKTKPKHPTYQKSHNPPKKPQRQVKPKPSTILVDF